jgi:D-alanyl-D-alanine carboxypeptidase
MAVSGLGYDRGAAGIRANVAPAKRWTASIGLAQTSPSHWLRVSGLLVMLMIVGAAWTQTEARSPRKDPPKRPIHGPNYRPPYAAIVIDDKSGFVLHEVSADEPRHPASLTKIMTLYLLFEQLEAGKLGLDTELPISTRAALQNPTKLGLKANQTITVEDAIKGLVTKSANDAAVVVAEALGGSEAEFAKLMTLKARMLGMTSTTYVNASGLPAEEQITTARDQAVLGRAIQHRFPVYYQYFATPSFRYKGAEMHNHNALLGQVKGVDGIKTGYTEASGYNLVSSVRRDEKHIVGVVLGGTSNAARDARMRQLIEDNISLASTQRTVPVIVDANGRRIADEGWALYLAAQWLEDARWRYQSPARIARFYGDLGWKRTDAEVQLVASEANNFFGVSEPTRAQLRAANGRYSDRWTVQSNLYGRAFGQGNPLFHTLCLESDGVPTQPQANVQVLGPDNQPTKYSPDSGNACAPTPWEAVERTFINALTTGGALETATTTR